nr:MAG TPA: hypothetical protein [Crassvirales sp.]
MPLLGILKSYFSRFSGVALSAITTFLPLAVLA